MELQEAKEKYIQAWGTLGSSWGISRTMAQIHSLLLVAEGPLCAEEVMAELQISRGNANMNLRALIDWGLVQKELKVGERKEFFVAEKNIWEVARCVMMQRKKKELEPVIKVLHEVSQVDAKDKSSEAEAFKKSVKEISEFADHVDKVMELMIKADSNWFFKTMLNLLRKGT